MSRALKGWEKTALFCNGSMKQATTTINQSSNFRTKNHDMGGDIWYPDHVAA
jgi:hypothetical protein